MASTPVALRYLVPEPPQRWLLEEDDVPETPPHDAIIELLMLVLKHMAHIRGRSALICSNLGCRWDPNDSRVGMDPDVVFVEPTPSDVETLTTLRIWEPGHAPPRLAVEIVSSSNPEKDYEDAPARAARLGVEELWIFDPDLHGPSSTGGPFLLQIWRPTQGAKTGSAPQPVVETNRVYAGEGPAHSPLFDAWLVATDGGRRLRIADDREGERLWPTRAEAEAARAEAEAARADAEAARADAEAARANAAEAELARLKARTAAPDPNGEDR